jgi:hypothetical protein
MEMQSNRAATRVGQGIVEANDMNQYTLASNFSVPGTVANDDSDSDEEESSKPQLYDNSNQFGKAHVIDEEEDEDIPEPSTQERTKKESGYLKIGSDTGEDEN